MCVFNEACAFIAEVAFRERCASKSALQKLVYAEVRQQFGLSAQLTIRAIAKVVKAYKRDKTKQCFFKPTGAVVYERRILSFKGLEFASLLTLEGRLSVPMQMVEYQPFNSDTATVKPIWCWWMASLICCWWWWKRQPRRRWNPPDLSASIWGSCASPRSTAKPDLVFNVPPVATL